MSEATDPTLLDLRAALAGAYEIEAPLGRGGMAQVYLARERRLDRRVAVKVLPPELAADEACRRRFLREARTIARLTHPNIVPIFAVDEIGTFVFFAMAYVAGETLSRRVATRGRLEPHRAARLLCDIGLALGYAHARGVVHRDVKPDNILLDAATGHALLSDFGIAHASPVSAPPALLGRPAAPRGQVVGTAAFMSPEQARGDPVDARSDLYSLGVVAYYALAGRLPFHATTDSGLLAMHIAEPAPPLATVAPFVPRRLAQIVDRCLAKEPWARFPDAAALVRAVEEAVEPPPAPLAVRAFLVRGPHVEGPALLLLAPLAVLLVRVRRLVAAGHRREELVAALAARQGRRREELAFVYGSGPPRLERACAWLSRVAVLAAAAAVAAGLGWVGLPPPLVPLLPLLPAAAVAAAATSLVAGILARARTEKRTDPRGERRLRFWRGPLGRWLFRLAGVGLKPAVPIVTILGRLETPA